jgi:hypothetical protein
MYSMYKLVLGFNCYTNYTRAVQTVICSHPIMPAAVVPWKKMMELMCSVPTSVPCLHTSPPSEEMV